MLTAPVHARAGSREVWWIDSRVDVILAADQTGGHAGMWLWHARRGAASPLHLHRREDEQFLVVDGTARFVVGDERIDAGPGDTVLLPRDVPHAYLVTSETARLVGSVTPGGFEAFFTRLGAPVIPGAPEGPPPSVAAMAGAAPELGIEILGPPPALD
jgi:mannose-6-phosphate isomerase-like protein (cupin superfamily)